MKLIIELKFSYDIQISPSSQGMGLGKKLLEELAKLGQAFQMQKILLTVLKSTLASFLTD